MNEQAMNAFMKDLNESKAKLEALTAYVESHMNYDAGEINWGHAGNAAHLNSMLGQIMDSFGQGETAEAED